MNLESIKNSLTESEIFHSEITILDNAAVVGYEKKFKWSWVATQLNTFIVATDLKDEEITVEIIEKHLSKSFKFSKKNYTGWPRGLQSALGVISVLISTKMNEEAKEYCRKLKSGKKWAGFTIPVIYDSEKNEIHKFEKNPIWGRIYYPHFKKLISNIE